MITRVSEIFLQIQMLEKELKLIRKKCSHKDFTPLMFSARVGHHSPERICSNCNDVVPGITDKEREKVWDIWNKGMGL